MLLAKLSSQAIMQCLHAGMSLREAAAAVSVAVTCPRLFCGLQQVLATAYAAHPKRFVRGTPRPPRVPKAVWINRPVGPGDPSIVAALRE